LNIVPVGASIGPASSWPQLYWPLLVVQDLSRVASVL